MLDIESMKKTAIGFAAGIVEVCVTQPIWAIKLQRQSIIRKPLNMGLTHLYRGTLFNFAGFSGTIAMQVGIYEALQKQWGCQNDEKPKGIAALIAGVASSVIACPAEMLMTQQHERNATPLRTASVVFKQYGIKYAYTGLPATGIQESISSSFFLLFAPLFKEVLSPYIPQKDILSFAAGTISGIGAALASQPANTIRTIQQKSNNPLTFFETAHLIYSKYGVRGLYQGTDARLKIVVLSMATLMLVKDNLEQRFCEPENPREQRCPK